MNTTELRGFLTGLILGDGSIDAGVTKRAFAIKSIDKYFIDMIKSEIDSVCGFSSYIKFTKQHFSCGCNHKNSWEFRIRSHPYFAKLYHHFYDDYRKRRITKEAINWLTPYGLANWYMSDGYICLVGKTKGVIRDRRVDICTDRYNIDSIKTMQDFLFDRFYIRTSTIKRNNTYRIRISKQSYQTFFDIINPYIIDSMKYKLYFAYDSQPIWMSNEMWEYQERFKSAIAQTGKAVG